MAQSPALTPPVADRHAAAEPFELKAAVDAKSGKDAGMLPAERVRSNAYFKGGYWLLLGDFLSIVVVMWLLLRFQWSMRMRDLAERHYALPPPAHLAPQHQLAAVERLVSF